jgi:hypothetical protein
MQSLLGSLQMFKVKFLANVLHALLPQAILLLQATLLATPLHQAIQQDHYEI